MTKKQAILKMKEGKKITHRYFTPKEWMTIKNGKFHFEDGNVCDQWEFWKWKTLDGWDEGYSIWQQ